ncbi:MAG: RHS repeat-associated core domain-containing protein, partial [Planctomycetes bacterium]|nr:RHS repeat-associated core domain-containing protein [Planctomycetota bacterium]
EDFGGLNLSTAWTLDAVGNVTSVTSPRVNTLSFEVNRANQVTQVDGPLGYQVKLTHDENGRLLEQRVKNLDGDGLLSPTLPWVVTTRTYTILGDVASETRTVWAGENATSSFAYDAEQNLLGITYPSGRHDAFVSEGRGLVTRATFGDGSAHPVVREFTYNAWGNADSISTAAGTAWMTYDGFGRKKMTVYPTSTAILHSYDADCHEGENSSQDGSGGTGGSGGGNNGGASARGGRQDHGPGGDAPSGSQTGAFSSCSGGFGAVTSESTNKDENHRPYRISKAHKNSQQQPIAGGTSVQSANLDPNSNITGITTASGGTLTITRDGADRATAVFRPASSQGGGGGAPGGGGGGAGGGGCLGLGGDGVSAVLDADGNATLITWTTENTATGQLETRCQERQYDPYGRLSAIIEDPGLGGANLTTHFKHDSLGNVVEVEDPKGNRIQREHDGRGNVRTHVYQPVGGPTITLAFGYDADGNLTTLMDGLGHTTTYMRDTIGRATQVIYPNQTTETFEYDGNGWPIRSTDANGTVVETAYNWFGMPFQRGMTLAPGVEGAISESITYDGVLRPVTISGESGSTSIEYTSLHQVEKLHRTIDDAPGIADTSFEFDSAGERTRMTYPNGRVLDFTRDDRDRLRQVREGTTTLAAYDYAGQVMSRRTYSNGLTLEISRDALFRVTTWQHVQGAGTIRAGFEHAYDELGQKKYEHRLHDGLADVYRYDGLGQLTGVKSGIPEADLTPTKDYADYSTFTSQRQFEFDFGGNRKTVDSDGVVSYYNHVNGLYVPDLVNRIRSVDDTTRTHDANGNVTDDGRNTYTYNWRNQIVRAHRKSDGKLIAHYLYDAFGRRERKYTIDVEGMEAGWVDFLLDGYRIIGERDQSGAYLATYVNGNGIDEVLAMDRGGQRYFLHEDSLGSVRLVTDAAGHDVEKYEYTEYGLPTVWTWDPQANGGAGGWGAGVLGGASAIGNTRMFTGREWDAEVELYSYRSRHFDPRSGRFVSPDPIGYSGDDLTNVYRYALNAPSNYTDPLGLDGWDIAKGLARTIGGLLEAGTGLGVAAATSWSGVGLFAGGAVAAHGLDQVQAGIRQMLFEEDAESVTSIVLQTAGLSPTQANIADAGISIAGSLGGGLYTASVKVATVQATDKLAQGLSKGQVLCRVESGARALNDADYLALGGRATSDLAKADMIERGVDASGQAYKLTTTFAEQTAKSIALAGTGVTPKGNILVGAAGAAGGATGHVKQR